MGKPPTPEDEGRDSFYDDVRVRRLYEQAERVIQDATSPEKMKNNPYRGRPLNLNSNPHEGSYGLAFRMLKSSGFKLPWMELRDEITTEKEALRELVRRHVAWVEERLQGLDDTPRGTKGERASVHDDVSAKDRRFHEQLEERVNELRKKISRFNLEVPLLHQQVVNVQVQHFLAPHQERLAELMEHLANAEGSAE